MNSQHHNSHQQHFQQQFNHIHPKSVTGLSYRCDEDGSPSSINKAAMSKQEDEVSFYSLTWTLMIRLSLLVEEGVALPQDIETLLSASPITSTNSNGHSSLPREPMDIYI
jgi:hypothetical protein